MASAPKTLTSKISRARSSVVSSSGDAGEVERRRCSRGRRARRSARARSPRPASRGRGSATSPATNDATSCAELSRQLARPARARRATRTRRRSLAGERPGDRATDAFGRACDDRDLAAEATAHEHDGLGPDRGIRRTSAPCRCRRRGCTAREQKTSGCPSRSASMPPTVSSLPQEPQRGSSLTSR